MTNFSPRDEIGVYRIIRLLGEGGMGTVYEVEHVKLGVHYALKTFSLVGNEHVEILKSKFIAEGKGLARLRNPHIVRVFDLNFDEQTQTPYFVMGRQNCRAFTLSIADCGMQKFKRRLDSIFGWISA